MEGILKIIGYSSDDVYEAREKFEEQVVLAYKRLKQQRKSKNQLEAEARKNAVDREAHVYLINNTKTYYKIYRELNEFVGYGEVKYLGIGLEPNISIKEKLKKLPKKINKANSGTSYFKEGMICCYCSVKLTRKSCTREHVIPKHKGGKIIEPCCHDCNNEKGGLMIHSFIDFLRFKNARGNGIIDSLNKIKIENAISIAKKHNLNY